MIDLKMVSAKKGIPEQYAHETARSWIIEGKSLGGSDMGSRKTKGTKVNGVREEERSIQARPRRTGN